MSATASDLQRIRSEIIADPDNTWAATERKYGVDHRHV